MTLGLLVARRTERRTAAAYIVAQLVGAVLAAVLLKACLPDRHRCGGISLGTPTIANSIQFHQAMIMEAVMAFLLVSAVFGTCRQPGRAPASAGSASAWR